MGTGGIHHVPEVIELVARVLLCCPSLIGSPAMGMLGIDGAGGVEIAVGLLGSSHHIEHRVDIGFQSGVWISL